MNWELEIKKLKDLKVKKNNPRRLSKHDAQHLQESIERFGICQPLVLDTENTIIGGHQRFRILKKMGYTEVPAYVPVSPFTEEEKDELCIRLNRNHGEFDFDILGNEWDIDLLLGSGFLLEELEISTDEDTKQEEASLKGCKMNITFSDPEHLQEAESAIATIVDSYPGATYKVRLK